MQVYNAAMVAFAALTLVLRQNYLIFPFSLLFF
jgi:hypothetical protein